VGVSGQVREMLKRDEIVWFIRHSSKENQNKKTAEEDFRDSKISELISSVIQLRTLVQKHSVLLSKYYAGLMPKFNAHLLHAETKKLPTMPDEESILITSFVNTMGNLKETMVQNEETMAQVRRELMGFRLDWFRFQAYTSVAKASCDLRH
jgi:NCK-associated protein 1